MTKRNLAWLAAGGVVVVFLLGGVGGLDLGGLGGQLPFVLMLLLCPLLHLFGMHGHKGHGQAGTPRPTPREVERPASSPATTPRNGPET